MPETDRKVVEKLLVTSPILGGVRNRWQSDLKDLETLLGTWHVSVGDFVSEKTFGENGSIFSTQGAQHGIWTIKDTVIHIRYSDKLWETLQRPLDPSGTRGESWTGKPVKATKLNFKSS